MNVLLSAYACEPNRGSEPGVGWNWARQAARFNDVWVLTRANNRAVIEAELEHSPIPRLHFVYHDLPHWVRRWKRGNKRIRPYYVMWQLTALQLVRRLHREIGFDVIHHVTLNTVEMPGFLWLLSPRFVWGPVGGAQVPRAELKEYFGRSWYREVLRIGRKRLVRLNPIVRSAARRASVVLVANEDTRHTFNRLGIRRLICELETAVAMPPKAAKRSRVDDRDLTILWAGALIRRKGPTLAVDVLAELRRRGIAARLVMAGDGPLRSSVAGHISKAGLASSIDLVGAVSYTSMEQLYQRADVFLFSSLHDTSGNVLLEAMAHEVPIVTLDQHGAREIVTGECGIKVPIISADQVRRDLASALELLAHDPALCERMGQAGRQRVTERYGWDRKGMLLKDLYLQNEEEAGAPTRSGPA